MEIKKTIFRYKYSLVALAIISANLFLRLHEIGIRPVWYTDEGSALNVTWNLLHGQLRYLELKMYFIPHLPLFYLLSSLFVLIFGKTILAIRLFANICIIASISIAYFIGKEMGGKKFGLASVSVLSVFSIFFLTARYAFLSSLDVLEIALIILFSVKYLKTENEKWIRYLSFALACAFLSEIYLWGMAIVLPLFLWPKKRKLLAKSLLITAFPVFLFFAAMAVIGGKGFVNDINFYYFARIFSNLDSTYSPAEKLANISSYWAGFYFWNLAGPIGLFFVSDKKIRKIFIILFLVIFIPILSFVSLSFLMRNQVLFMYLTAFGSVSLIFWSYSWLLRRLNLLGKFSRYVIMAVFLLAVLKTFQFQILDDYAFSTEYNDHVQEMIWINSTVSFLNNNSSQDDYVISTGDSFVHLLNSKIASIAQVTAYQGMGNSIYSPKYLDKSRFYSDISIKKAKFIIYDKEFEKFFNTDEPNIVKAINSMSNWPTVFEAGHYIIKQNPAIE
jgi:4-amino-4-deoxy-L-arabinose transferase-like glycosyltransferase